MSCNNVQILNFNHSVVALTNGNTLVITDNVKCNSITIPQPVTNILQINSPGPQGPAGTGANINTGSFVTTSSFNAYTGSSTSQFAGTSSYTLTASYAMNGGGGGNSFPFSGSAVITGSLLISQSGLTVIGNQIITGSILMSGSSSISGVDYIDFDTVASNAGAIARLKWNDTDGTLDLGLKGGNVTLQIGQEQLVRVVNKTATNITLLEANYQAVKLTGAQGQRLKVDLAQATSDSLSAETLGLVTETIANNQEGFVTTSGLVRGIDTTGTLQGESWVDGDVLYLSPTTAGRITNIKPVAPNHLVIIGYVVHAHSTQGTIFVKVDNGYEIDELHNVLINTGSLTPGQLLVRSGSVWINSTQLTGSYGLTGSLTVTQNISASSFTGSLFGTSSWASNAVTASYVLASNVVNLFQISTGSVTASVNVTTSSIFQVSSGSTNFITVNNSGSVTFAGGIASTLSSNLQQSATAIFYTRGFSGALGIGSYSNAGIELQAAQNNGTTVNGLLLLNRQAGQILIGTADANSGHKVIISGSTSSGSLNVDNVLFVSGSKVTVGGPDTSDNYIELNKTAIGTSPFIDFLYKNVVSRRISFITDSTSLNITNGFLFSSDGTVANAQQIIASDILAKSNIDVQGGIFKVIGTGDNYIRMYQRGVAERGTMGYAAGSGTFQIRVGGATTLSDGTLSTAFYSSGNVGIGTSATSDGGFKLDVNGTIRSQGKLTISTGGATIVGNTDITGSLNITGSASITGSLVVTGPTTLLPVTNSFAISSSGYYVTSSNASSMIDLSGTWATSGTPTAVKLNITDTTSNANSLLIDLQVGGTSQFRVTKGGSLTITNVMTANQYSSTQGVISLGTSNVSMQSVNSRNQSSVGRSLFLRTDLSTVADDGVYIAGNSNLNIATGTQTGVTVNNTIAYTTGTGSYNAISVPTTISSSAAASGSTVRGLFIAPTFTTNVGDYRAIETTAGRVILASSAFTSSVSQSILSYFTITGSMQQVATTSSQIYATNIIPSITYTAPSQTNTAFRVSPTFTGAAALTTTQQNIIADFGATAVGSQFVVNDITSGSIYQVNDISGLPIIEATSNWNVNIYDYPNIVFQKTGSSINISGSLTVVTGSGIEFQVTNTGVKIGNMISDTHQVTGSLNVTGSLIMSPTSSFVLPLTASASPATGSAYWSGSFLFIYDGTQYRSASFA